MIVYRYSSYFDYKLAKTSKKLISDWIFIDFNKVKISNPFYSKIPCSIFTKLLRQLKIYSNFENQLKKSIVHEIMGQKSIFYIVPNICFSRWFVNEFYHCMDPEDSSLPHLVCLSCSSPLICHVLLICSQSDLQSTCQ